MMMTKNTSRTKKNYSSLLKQYFEDANLSMDATGMLAYLLGRPVGEPIDHDELLNAKSDSRNHTQAIIKELEEAGYLQVFQSDEGGTQYLFHEVPVGSKKRGQK